MKIQIDTLKKIALEIICMLFILLFVYAAISKLLDYENFQVQIGQSPLLSSYAGILSITVPITELIISIGLLFSATRVVSMYACFFLMIMFSAYIFMMINFTSFLPCSCGGILEKMTWTQHLIFNLVFAVLAVLALILLRSCGQLKGNRKFVFSSLLLSATSGIALVTALFLLSENAIMHRNDFIRRFPGNSSLDIYRRDLVVSTYYIAGIYEGKIYLGSHTAPLELRIFDSTLTKKQSMRVSLDNMDLPFQDIKILLQPPCFFVADGTIPAIFKGKIGNWAATQLPNSDLDKFSQAVAPDTSTLAVFGIRNTTRHNTLGRVSIANGELQWKDKWLTKDYDGLFETDGLLIKNSKLDNYHFIYYYRNQFLTMNGQSEIASAGRTIDTVSKAVLNVATLKDGTQKKLKAPPLVINNTAAASGNLLFVNSARIGKYESKKVWKQADIIDVYNWTNNTYCYSFRVYHIEGQKLSSFWVQDEKLYALNGKWLTVVPLNKNLIAKYNISN